MSIPGCAASRRPAYRSSRWNAVTSPGSVVMGVPGRIKPLREDQLVRIQRHAQNYVDLKALYLSRSGG